MASSAPLAARRPRRFYTVAAFLAAAVVFSGFARSYYLKDLFGGPPLPGLLHAHGLVMTAWMVLLALQAVLVASGRTRLHRRLGAAGGVLAAAAVVTGVYVAINAVRLGRAPGGVEPHVFLAVPIGDMFVFGVLVGAGLYFRRRPELHKRLMLLGTIAILPAAFGRRPWTAIVPHQFGFLFLADLVFVGCAAYDWRKTRRLNPAWVWGGLFLVASHPLRIMLAYTDAWMTVARWMTGV